MTKNIIIAPCGNKSFLFKEAWLKYKNDKDFDICLLFYHDNIDNPENYKDADFFYHLKGFKYFMIDKLLTELHPEWLDQYDYFYFLDDDIEIDTHQINKLFSFSKAFKADISCASLTEDSFCSWPIFKHKTYHFCRYVGQIEVMAPLFSKEALRVCLPTFTGTRSSWGLDAVWPKLLGYPTDKLIIFDCVTMKHIYPVGGGELYKKIGVDPEKEWKEFTKLHGAKPSNLQEYNKLLIISNDSNWFTYYYNLSKRTIKRKKQVWKGKRIGRVMGRLLGSN